MMKLKLIRKYFKESYTIGDLYVNGTYFSNTLEDKNRDLNKNGKFDNGEIKIYSETCIPFGIYPINLIYSPKFKRELPMLQNVNSFTGILIHSGNTNKDTSGCILVGENKVVGKLVNSREHERRLVAKIKEAINKKESVIIEIV